MIRVKIDCSPELELDRLLSILEEYLDDLRIPYRYIRLEDDEGNEVSQERDMGDPHRFDRKEEKEEA